MKRLFVISVILFLMVFTTSCVAHYSNKKVKNSYSKSHKPKKHTNSCSRMAAHNAWAKADEARMKR